MPTVPPHRPPAPPFALLVTFAFLVTFALFATVTLAAGPPAHGWPLPEQALIELDRARAGLEEASVRLEGGSTVGLGVEVRSASRELLWSWAPQPLQAPAEGARAGLRPLFVLPDEPPLLLVALQAGSVHHVWLLRTTPTGLEEVFATSMAAPTPLKTAPGRLSLTDPTGKELIWSWNGSRFVEGLAPAAAPVAVPTAKTIAVKTAADLIRALGSDRTIELAPGIYDLAAVKDGLPPGVSLEDVFDGQQLILSNLSNLTVRGPAGGRAELRVAPRYAYVLTFKKAANITLENLLLQHAPELGECAGGVLAIEDGAKVTLANVELAGCGTEGLTLTRVNELTFKGSTITKCTNGILTADTCRDMRFEGSRFVDNGEYDLVTLNGCADVTFTRCVFQDNRAPEGKLFAVEGCEGLVLLDVKASGNTVQQLSNDEAVAAQLK